MVSYQRAVELEKKEALLAKQRQAENAKNNNPHLSGSNKKAQKVALSEKGEARDKAAVKKYMSSCIPRRG